MNRGDSNLNLKLSPNLDWVYRWIMRGEAKASKHINVVAHYDDDTLIDKSGKLIKIIKLAGLDFITQHDSTLDVYKNRRNSLFKHFTSEYALYFWTVRARTAEFPEGKFKNAFAHLVNEKYKNKILNTEMYHNTLYMAIVAKQPEGFINKGLSLVKHVSQHVDKSAKQAYLVKRHKELQDTTKKVLSSLSEYNPDVLSIYEKNGIKFSQPFEFLSQLLNGEKYSIPSQMTDASFYLVKKRHFFSKRSGTIELRAADNSKKFAATLSIKEYDPFTHQGILDELSALRIEYVITQSFRFYDRQSAKSKLRDQQKDMQQSRDESQSQTEEISEAFDHAASGEAGFGAHHLTLICYASDQEELNRHVGTIIAKFSDIDIVCVREDIACECGFWAQLPGNFSYIVRPADISTRNLAGFVSLHNYASGKIKGNYWGDAVTVFETLSGSPYYFNFHSRDVGNFLVFGTMGSGKTVLIGFLISQSMKFGGKRVIFDKDRGLEILIRAMGGTYEILKPGIPTGFNPCQLDDTPENRKFLAALFKKMLTVTGNLLTESDYEIIDAALIGMYRLAFGERQLCHIASFFGTKRKGSLRARFDQWHSQGAHAWLLDNANDSLHLDADVLGFDLGHILKDEDCKTPALMYLMHRVRQSLEGQRGMIFADEGWNALADGYFKDVFNEESRTPRKKNNILGLATQAAEDTVNSAISKTLNESAACKIFFPNSTANRQIYMDEFGLTDQEYELVKTLPDDKNFFLLNYGRGQNKESVVIRANLQGLEDEIAVISGRESTLQLLDDIRAQHGDDPNVWLPIFHERRKAGLLA